MRISCNVTLGHHRIFDAGFWWGGTSSVCLAVCLVLVLVLVPVLIFCLEPPCILRDKLMSKCNAAAVVEWEESAANCFVCNARPRQKDANA